MARSFHLSFDASACDLGTYERPFTYRTMICIDTEGGRSVPVLLIARFDGDVVELTRAYDEAHRLIMERGGPPGELRHHCAVGDSALYIVGVWESEEMLRTRFASAEFRETLASVDFPSFDDAEVTILQLHAIEPPLETP